MQGLTLVRSKTNRGFDLIEFRDLYDESCSLQKSSLATDDAIWLGVHSATPKRIGDNGWEEYKIPSDVYIGSRMHLNKEQVKQLLPILKRFAKTGRLK